MSDLPNPTMPLQQAYVDFPRLRKALLRLTQLAHWLLG